MSELNQNRDYLKDSLREMVTRLAYPGSLSAVEIARNGRIAEAVLYLFDQLEELKRVKSDS
jgi:hypothetical protein